MFHKIITHLTQSRPEFLQLTTAHQESSKCLIYKAICGFWSVTHWHLLPQIASSTNSDRSLAVDIYKSDEIAWNYLYSPCISKAILRRRCLFTDGRGLANDALLPDKIGCVTACNLLRGELHAYRFGKKNGNLKFIASIPEERWAYVPYAAHNRQWKPASGSFRVFFTEFSFSVLFCTPAFSLTVSTA